MKTKTIHLDPDAHRLHDGVVQFYKFAYDSVNYPLGSGTWVKTKYYVGAEAILISNEDVSPRSNSPAVFSLFFDLDGVGGNMNDSIKCYHGWRGTTCENSLVAHGRRRITKIRELQNGRIAVTVGADLFPNEE